MQNITIYDFVLLPVYLFIFYIFVKRKSLRYSDVELRKIFLIAFGLRMLGSIAYAFLIQYYYGFGDSFTFYSGGNFIIEQIQDNFSNIKYIFTPAKDLQRIYAGIEGGVGGVNGYIGISSSAAIMKASAVTAALSFNKYLITSLFFGLFSFIGQWKLFMVFYKVNKGQHKKLLAIAVLYSPAIWFWGSGLLKESICLGAFGIVVSILYSAYVNRKISVFDWILLAAMTYLVYIVKSYIIITFLSAIIITTIFFIFQRIKIVILRLFVIFLTVFIISIPLSLSDFTYQINDLVEESVSQIETYQKNYQNIQDASDEVNSGFTMTEVNPSFGSFVLRAPMVILSCLYRPFLWESRKLIMLLSSLESTVLLLMTLFLMFKTRFFGFFRIIFANRFIFLCLVVSLLFAAIIGFTTFNFGTMVRYKIMLLPFYYSMLVFIYTKTTPGEQNQPTVSS